MSAYARFRATLDVSLNSNSVPNTPHALDVAYTSAGEYAVNQRRLIGYSGTEIIETAVAFAAGVRWLLIYNEDPTNYITLTYRSAGNGSTNNVVRIPALSPCLLSDVTETTNPTLQANTAACYCQISIIGT